MSDKPKASIEALVHAFVEDVAPHMSREAQSCISTMKPLGIMPDHPDMYKAMTMELSLAAIARSIALTPDPVAAIERQRWVTAHRESSAKTFLTYGVKDGDEILRHYCAAHDKVAAAWNHPLKRMFTNIGYKCPMQHILEIFPVVMYDRLGFLHAKGEGPEYPEFKDLLVIGSWHHILSGVTNSYWNGALQKYRME